MLDGFFPVVPSIAAWLAGDEDGTGFLTYSSGARRVKCVVTINGLPVAGVFWERLISITIKDHEGHKSDSIDMTFLDVADEGGGWLAIPQNDDEIRCWLGYEDGPFDEMGMWAVNDVKLDSGKMQVTGKAADQTEKWKEHQRQHWDDASVGQVVADVAKRLGVEAQVAQSFFADKHEYIAQDNVSPQHFLETLARDHNGLFAIKNGKMLFGERGSGKTPGGADLPPQFVGPGNLIKNSWTVHFGKRPKHSEVHGEYHDHDKAKRRRVTSKGDRDAKATYTTRSGNGSKSSAKAAAKAARKQLKRDGTNTTCRVEGNPFLKGGGPFVYAGLRPGVDGLIWIASDATHTLSKTGGYVTALTGNIKDEGGAGKSGGKATEADDGEARDNDEPEPKPMTNEGVPSGVPGTYVVN
jgi:uncharacterized protein